MERKNITTAPYPDNVSILKSQLGPVPWLLDIRTFSDPTDSKIGSFCLTAKDVVLCQVEGTQQSFVSTFPLQCFNFT
jgi:hypothetical protein